MAKAAPKKATKKGKSSQHFSPTNSRPTEKITQVGRVNLRLQAHGIGIASWHLNEVQHGPEVSDWFCKIFSLENYLSDF